MKEMKMSMMASPMTIVLSPGTPGQVDSEIKQGKSQVIRHTAGQFRCMSGQLGEECLLLCYSKETRDKFILIHGIIDERIHSGKLQCKSALSDLSVGT